MDAKIPNVNDWIISKWTVPKLELFNTCRPSSFTLLSRPLWLFLKNSSLWSNKIEKNGSKLILGPLSFWTVQFHGAQLSINFYITVQFQTSGSSTSKSFDRSLKSINRTLFSMTIHFALLPSTWPYLRPLSCMTVHFAQNWLEPL